MKSEQSERVESGINMIKNGSSARSHRIKGGGGRRRDGRRRRGES